MKGQRLIIEVGFHIILGLVALRFSGIANLWMMGYFAYCFSKVMKHNNRHGEAHMYAAYFMAYEAFYRMTGTGSLPYEFGKYAVIILLFFGMFSEKGKKKGNTSMPLLYLLLLVPAALLTDFGDFGENRRQIFFYLSGPLCLMISARYFYLRKLSNIDFKRLLYNAILGFIPMFIYLYGFVPLDEVEFNTDANFATTGGFGSNQVSTAIGLAMLFMMILYLRKEVLFKYKYLDWFLLGFIIFRGLLSFSRGGMVTPVLAIVIAVLLFSKKTDFIKTKIKNLIPKVIVISILFGGMFYYANQITENKLMLRYTGMNEAGEQKEFTSGRLEMVASDWELFADHPLFGVGVGMAKVKRSMYGSHIRASHTELTRMLAEHGSFGVLSLIVLLLFPLVQIKKNKKLGITNFILVSFSIFAIVTMSHSAMRMAIPSFMYGLAFIHFIKDDTTRRKQASK